MGDFLASMRRATRSVTRAPASAALAVAILAIGIGATTLMFSLLQAVLLHDLPFREPDRLVWLQ